MPIEFANQPRAPLTPPRKRQRLDNKDYSIPEHQMMHSTDNVEYQHLHTDCYKSSKIPSQQYNMILPSIQRCHIHRCMQKHFILIWCIDASRMIREELNEFKQLTDYDTSTLKRISQRLIMLLCWLGIYVDDDEKGKPSNEALLAFLESTVNDYCEECCNCSQIGTCRSVSPFVFNPNGSNGQWKNAKFAKWIIETSSEELNAINKNLFQQRMHQQPFSSQLDSSTLLCQVDVAFVIEVFFLIHNLWTHLWMRNEYLGLPYHLKIEGKIESNNQTNKPSVYNHETSMLFGRTEGIEGTTRNNYVHESPYPSYYKTSTPIKPPPIDNRDEPIDNRDEPIDRNCGIEFRPQQTLHDALKHLTLVAQQVAGLNDSGVSEAERFVTKSVEFNKATRGGWLKNSMDCSDSPNLLPLFERDNGVERNQVVVPMRILSTSYEEECDRVIQSNRSGHLGNNISHLDGLEIEEDTIPGVTFIKQTGFWRATWKSETKMKAKYFSIRKLGYEGARQEAIDFRRKRELESLETLNSVSIQHASLSGESNSLIDPRSDGIDFHLQTNAFRCHWLNSGRRHHKYFFVETYGHDEAKRRAIAFRKEKIRISEAINEQEIYKAISPIDSKTDESVFIPMKGVTYEKQCNSWRCNWTFKGQRFRRSFSVSRLGFDEARRRAIECRLNGLRGCHELPIKEVPTSLSKPIERRSISDINYISDASHLASAQVTDSVCASSIDVSKDNHAQFNPEKISPHPGVTFEKSSNSWISTWRYNGKRSRRAFSVKKLGFNQAKLCALECRKDKEQSGEANTVRCINIYKAAVNDDTQSPMEGVTFSKCTGAWRCHFTKDGRQCGKSFSCGKYGFSQAKDLAVKLRLETLRPNPDVERRRSREPQEFCLTNNNEKISINHGSNEILGSVEFSDDLLTMVQCESWTDNEIQE